MNYPNYSYAVVPVMHSYPFTHNFTQFQIDVLTGGTVTLKISYTSRKIKAKKFHRKKLSCAQCQVTNTYNYFILLFPN